jgi:hypothetical protein
MKKLTSLAGMLAVLILAYGLERGLHELQLIATRTFNAAPFAWTSVLANLALAGALLALAWFTLRQGERSRWVALIFLLVGALLVFAWPIFVSTLVRILPLDPRYLAPGSRLVYASAFIAAIGAFNLLRPDT